MKNDKYRDYRDLADHEVEGVDYRIRSRTAATLILAPHGGGIERGTSELAEAIADADRSLYIFEGLKAGGNEDLHITSSHFDEPVCLAMLAQAAHVVTVHGEERDDAVVFVGGLDKAGVDRMSASLASAGFVVKAPDKPHLEGRAKENVCNRGRSAAGVQLEITEGLKLTFFRSLSPRAERQHTTHAFSRFVGAVRGTLV